MANTNTAQTFDGSGATPAKFCFVCGSHMNESWHSSETGVNYVWYECSRPGCGQTYLIRELAQSGPVFNEFQLRA